MVISTIELFPNAENTQFKQGPVEIHTTEIPHSVYCTFTNTTVLYMSVSHYSRNNSPTKQSALFSSRQDYEFDIDHSDGSIFLLDMKSSIFEQFHVKCKQYQDTPYNV